MKASFAQLFVGACALVSLQGSLVSSASDDIGGPVAFPAEVEAIFSALTAFLTEYREVLAPLAIPTDARLNISKEYLKKTLPSAVASLPADEAFRLLDGVEQALNVEEEQIRVYNSMKALRTEILHEKDPEKEATLRERMAKYIERMEETMDQGVQITNAMQNIPPETARLFKQTPFMRAARAIFEEGVLSPFRPFT